MQTARQSKSILLEEKRTYLVVSETELLQLGQPVEPPLVHRHHLVVENSHKMLSLILNQLSDASLYLIPIQIQLLDGIKTIEGAVHQEP